VKEAVGEATREVSSEEVSTEMPDGKPTLREKNSRAAATGRFPSAATPSLKRGGKSWVCSATHDLVIGTVSIHSAATLTRGAPE
jgi:hypothetical protein